jgi:hypothetical protein
MYFTWIFLANGFQCFVFEFKIKIQVNLEKLPNMDLRDGMDLLDIP